MGKTNKAVRLAKAGFRPSTDYRHVYVNEHGDQIQESVFWHVTTSEGWRASFETLWGALRFIRKVTQIAAES